MIINSTQIKEFTILIYEELYKQCTLKRSFKLYIGKDVEGYLATFSQFLLQTYRLEEITYDLFIRYFEFQFSRYAGIKTRYGKNSILIHWLIGQKAIKLWQERDVKKNWIIKFKVKKDLNLKLRDTFAVYVKEQTQKKLHQELVALNEFEEREKKMFFNKPEGFLWCITTTSAYNPRSKLCENCNNKIDCLNYLQNKQPKIYELRITNGK